MSAVRFVVFLEALVGQVHIVVAVLQVVLARLRAQVAFSKDVNAEIIRHQRPHSNVEFASLVQEGLFNVLLHHPKGLFLIFLENEFGNVA